MKYTRFTLMLLFGLMISLILCLETNGTSYSPLAKTQKIIPLPRKHKEKQTMPLPKITYDITYGKQTAPHHLVNFFDIGCTHCATFFKETWPLIVRHFVDTGKIRVTFTPYPIHSETLLFMTCVEKLTPTEKQILFEVLMESDLSTLSAVTVMEQCMATFKKTVTPPSSNTLKKALYLTQKHEFMALPMLFWDGKPLSDEQQDTIVNFLKESLI